MAGLAPEAPETELTLQNGKRPATSTVSAAKEAHRFMVSLPD